MPASAAGGAYILEATANVSDGRLLKLNATLDGKMPSRDLVSWSRVGDDGTSGE